MSLIGTGLQRSDGQFPISLQLLFFEVVVSLHWAFK